LFSVTVEYCSLKMFLFILHIFFLLALWFVIQICCFTMIAVNKACIKQVICWFCVAKCLLALAELRDYHGFEHKDLLDKTFGIAVRVMGPRVVLVAVPLCSQLSRSLVIRPHCMRMQPIATVCVCVSLCWIHWWSLQKQLKRSQCHLGCVLGEKPCIKWGPGSLRGKRHFQGHTCACREWSVVCVLNILNVVCKGAAVNNK